MSSKVALHLKSKTCTTSTFLFDYSEPLGHASATSFAGSLGKIISEADGIKIQNVGVNSQIGLANVMFHKGLYWICENSDAKNEFCSKTLWHVARFSKIHGTDLMV